ncbi:MAG TPA: NAD(P)H-dependent oxidoreductase [Devosia sp.]|jgi:NAD(P)H-dependent FMN reductase|uniref:NADPH-dependent FMN reductase n=1 Tax=Devosia sp. TaxID=1871048 RepID=UPI002DDD5DE0|nr:NAD(P)H-dependent oxidoreductase [Devosia sp.]HEV2513875.1 NAD(P)H-dependent oxidoreductase [Devosia sp.]
MTIEAPPPKTAITICGSLRKDSINEPLRRHMSAKLREAGVVVTDLDLREFEMPIFNQDIEDAGETPEAAKRLAQMFREHDIVLIISPEYNGGVTPLIANLVSWVSREKPNPFKHAVFGIGGMSDGKYATIFALSHLRDSLSKIGALVVPTLLGLGPYPDVLDEDGAPNEGNIKWKVGQMVRELTHFSRGGI